MRLFRVRRGWSWKTWKVMKFASNVMGFNIVGHGKLKLFVRLVTADVKTRAK